MVALKEMVAYANQALCIKQFSDYCPNGLQVQGSDKVTRLVAGVTASQAMIDAAIDWGADALLVHHGFFWRNEDPVITGMKQKRLKALLSAEINLLAYHLPLDCHPVWGNNAQLAKQLGIEVTGPLCRSDIKVPGLQGIAPKRSIQDWAALIERQLGRAPLILDMSDVPNLSTPWFENGIQNTDNNLQRLGWCTGAGQSFIDKAAAEGLDIFISGEASEPTFHSALEQGISYLGIGHHASERFGVQVFGAHLAQRFELEFQYIECPNPI